MLRDAECVGDGHLGQFSLVQDIDGYARGIQSYSNDRTGGGATSGATGAEAEARPEGEGDDAEEDGEDGEVGRRIFTHLSNSINFG